MWRKPFNYSVQRGVDPEKLSRLQRYRYYQRLAAPMTFVSCVLLGPEGQGAEPLRDAWGPGSEPLRGS